MGHWFRENERGLTFSIWNTSHNVGGGIAGAVAGWAAATFGGRQHAFFIPGVLAVIGSIYLFWRLAIANFFAYITRYSMLDWGPTYLREMKGATLEGGGIAILILEFGGIPSTIVLGWLSDLIGGRRGMVATVSLVPILAAFTVMVLTPAGHLWLDMTMLCIIGFFIYPVINLIVIMALDLTSKKAIGTAAGFIGLFGYIGRTCQAKGFGWMLKHFPPLYGKEAAWQMVIYVILACTAVAIVLLALTWRLKPRRSVEAAPDQA